MLAAIVLLYIAVIPFLIGVGLLVVSAVIKGRMEKLEKIKEKKEMIGTKMEAASNVSYMLRIEKEVGDSGAERINYICGYCGVKNNLKTIDEEHGIFQCLNCGAENHLLK